MSHSYALQRLLNFLVELSRNEASEAGGLDPSGPKSGTKNEIKTSWLKRDSVAAGKPGQFSRPHVENVSLPIYVYFCGDKRVNGTCLQCSLAELNSGISGFFFAN